MRLMMPLLAVAAFGVPFLAACVVETRTTDSNTQPTPTATETTPAPTQPMVVSVMSNQTMTANPGDGVGVFVEYKAGGHWKVWETCDTNKSNQGCDFTLGFSSATGALSNVASLPGAVTNTAPAGSGGGFTATTSITTQVAGVSFDAAPGARVTIDATVSGLHSGDFFFFVEADANGTPQVNGGYGGKLSDPLSFEPTAP